MDIALCTLRGNELSFAGANNPLWIIRNGELLETRGDSQPIGRFDQSKPFTTHEFELQKGDTIYIFSDGFADQFGGEKGKKFKKLNFKKLLLSIEDKPIAEHKKIIEETFDSWKGELEQIDDVCVMGVRV
jgi:serine phosphatase RsbU (regulator of sigma subunit)